MLVGERVGWARGYVCGGCVGETGWMRVGGCG